MPRHYGSANGRPAGLMVAALVILLASIVLPGCRKSDAEYAAKSVEPPALLNVSYDPTRELYWEFNQAFCRHLEETTGQKAAVRMSHGGSGSQSRAVIDGLQADVVTLALAYDVDAIAAATDLLPRDWRQRRPHGSSPYYSTVSFLVRKGNPKQIRDWDDLARPGVRVVTPDPATSGVARWNYLAMWAHVMRRELGPDYAAILADPTQVDAVATAQEHARAFVAKVFGNVPVLHRAAREATENFVHKHIGDVLINWENEVLLVAHKWDSKDLEVVVPSVSILTEPVVALVDGNAGRHGTREVAEAYLDFLYSDAGQDIIGRHFYRPAISRRAQETYSHQFPQVELISIESMFGGWAEAQHEHFAAGGMFAQIR